MKQVRLIPIFRGVYGDMSDDTATRRSLSEEIGYWLESASRTLAKRYGDGVPEAKQDILLAHYLYGLTAVAHADDAPAAHLAAVRSYLEQVIPAPRAAKALRAVPEEDDTWLLSALDRVEVVGARQGHALLARGADLGHFIPLLNRQASAAGSAEPAAIRRDTAEEALPQ